MIELYRADAEDGRAAIDRAGCRAQRLDLPRRGDDEAAADLIRARLAVWQSAHSFVGAQFHWSSASKQMWKTALYGEKASTIDQCCNRERLAERWVGLCGQLRVWHRIARSEDVLNHPYVTGAS
jgi:hypothetical protein